MTTQSPPIRKRKLSHEVQERLLRLIEDEEMRPGDPLPSERDLMQSYEVGRPAVREALQNLERMGLIAIRHGDHARVAEPSIGRMVDEMSQTMRHILSHSPTTMEHLKEARAMFEIEMVRIAARKHSKGYIVRLRRLLEEQAAARSDPARFLAGDAAFHREIASISGNPIFAAVTEAVFGWLGDFYVNLVRAPGRENVTLDEHQMIIDAIADGDQTRAAKAMSDHLSRASRLYHVENLKRPG